MIVDKKPKTISNGKSNLYFFTNWYYCCGFSRIHKI